MAGCPVVIREVDAHRLFDRVDGVIHRPRRLRRPGTWPEVERPREGGAVNAILQGALLDQHACAIDRQGDHREQPDARYGKDHGDLTAQVLTRPSDQYSVTMVAVATKYLVDMRARTIGVVASKW